MKKFNINSFESRQIRKRIKQYQKRIREQDTIIQNINNDIQNEIKNRDKAKNVLISIFDKKNNKDD